MYLRGRLTMHLSGTVVDLHPPRNFFGGVANLLTRGRWQTKEELETHKLLSFAQSANRALQQMGVNDVVRVAIDRETVYEDLQERPDDFGAAMQALQEKLAQGYEPDPHSEFDLVLKHDDGVLRYVIDLDFVREHKPGIDPVAITVTAVPSELRRLEGEDDAAYRGRISGYFSDQLRFDDAQSRWQAQLDGFMNAIADHFRTTLGIDDVHVETRRVLPRHRDAGTVYSYTTWGYPLYGYDPMYDLAYLMLWDSMWDQYRFQMGGFYYGDFGAPYTYVGDTGWGPQDAWQFDQSQPAFVPSDSGGGGWAAGGEWGAGASSGGGGGWLSSIGDFSSSSDSGGGGDVSGGSSCGGSSSSCGGSSCSGGSSCGGGGCSSS